MFLLIDSNIDVKHNDDICVILEWLFMSVSNIMETIFNGISYI